MRNPSTATFASLSFFLFLFFFFFLLHFSFFFICSLVHSFFLSFSFLFAFLVSFRFFFFFFAFLISIRSFFFFSSFFPLSSQTHKKKKNQETRLKGEREGASSTAKAMAESPSPVLDQWAPICYADVGVMYGV